jgi:hypothetical protein
MEIEKGIAIPKQKGNPSASIYPLSEMDVGDSFMMEAFDKIVMMKRIRSAISQYTKNRDDDKKFTTRAVDGGVRCWRIK